MPLFRRRSVMIGSHGMVLRHAHAAVIHFAETCLRRRTALCGGFAKPIERCGKILFHAFAAVIHKAEIVLRLGIALGGERAKHAGRRLVLAALEGGLSPVDVSKGGVAASSDRTTSA